MNCEACGKFFSGEIPWQQHLNSDKHKKKIALYNSADCPRQIDLKATQSNQYDPVHCPACNITCDSMQSFLGHSLSFEHVTNVSKKINQCEEIDSAIGIPSTERNDPRIDDKISNLSHAIDETDKILPDMTSHKILQLACTVCNKQFSGPEPYKQHMESSVHKKKVESQNYFNIGAGTVQNLSPLSCDVCKKMFSGKVPYEQHIVSDTHKKKVQSLEFMEKLKANSSTSCIAECDSSGDASNRIGDVNRFQMEDNFFCKLCNVQCSGPIPYRDHVSGEMHMKHLKRNELSRRNVSSLNCKSPNSQFSGENLHPSAPENHSSSLISNVETGDIIIEMSPHLGVKAIDQPKLKSFWPEDVLNFDELQMDENQDPLENKSDGQNTLTTQGNEIQKESTDVYHECQYCKVNLKNKIEALAHFESMEHFYRKWQSRILQ